MAKKIKPTEPTERRHREKLVAGARDHVLDAYAEAGGLLTGGPWAPFVDDADQDLNRHDPPWTKQRHPYSYDPFTIWGAPHPSEECTDTAYTDRLSEWDHGKYERLAAKHFRGRRPFDSCSCEGPLIEAFLRDWFDDPELRLLRVIEYCNLCTGFPTWRLDYASKKVAR